MTTKPTLYLIDGHSQVFKAYHAIQHLSNSKGVPTNAIYGFCQILHKLLRTRTPEYLAVVFDSHGPTFRHDMYDAYKANRSAPPEDLAPQVEVIVEILEAMRVPILRKVGYEADDIIATVVARARAEGYRVFVVTADKDLFQLVDAEQVRVLRLDPDREIEFDPAAVKEKMGVPPELIRDWLAMVGDSSDNVPGIAGVGPKKAQALLEQFGSLDGVLANTADIKGKLREQVETARDIALLSKKLVSLDDNVPVDYTLDDFRVSPPERARLEPLYREYELKRFLDLLPGAPTTTPAPASKPKPADEGEFFGFTTDETTPEVNASPEPAPATTLEAAAPHPARETHYRMATSLDDVRRIADDARRTGVIAFDTETDSLNTMHNTLIGLSLSAEPHHALYVPTGHSASVLGDAPQLDAHAVLNALAPVFTDESIVKVAHNIKFDIKTLLKYGVAFRGPLFDTLLASFLLDPDRRAHGLKDLALSLLAMPMQPISDLIGSGKNMISFADVDPGAATAYSCADADATVSLYQILAPRLDADNLRKLFDDVEMPLTEVLISMENTGIAIAPAHFRALSASVEKTLTQLRADIFAAAGCEFNLGSPKQVGDVLFNRLGLKTGRKTKTGFSTDVEVLEELASEHAVPRLMLEYRQNEKLRGTYIDVLPQLADPRTGRIHTNYNQTIAATGRLSSNEPNLQNIPVRTELGRQIRAGFVPSSPDHVLLSCDYSQIELRVAAHICQDETLIAAFRNGQDVHTQTAARVFGIAPESVTYEQRDKAKVINFGVLYGMSAHGLSARLKIPRDDAKKFIEGYFRAFAGVKQWIDATLESARELGYVVTLLGRRRYVREIRSANPNARAGAERIAINTPIQGTSADMIKLAMLRIHEWLRAENLQTKMLLQVHDELIFDVPKSELAQIEPRIVQLMAEALPLDVPIKVDSSAAENWADC